jgi:hypothetical protein
VEKGLWPFGEVGVTTTTDGRLVSSSKMQHFCGGRGLGWPGAKAPLLGGEGSGGDVTQAGR